MQWAYSNSNAFEWARWLPKNGQPKLLKVEIVSENERRFGTISGNITANGDNTTLKTRFCFDYKIEDEIYYRGKHYTIIGIGSRSLEVAPQALSMTKAKYMQEIYLELIEENDKNRSTNTSEDNTLNE